MTSQAMPAAQSLAVPADLERHLRSFLFLVLFLFTWISLNPFPDLSDPRLLEPVGDGNPMNQVVTTALTVAVVVFLAAKHFHVALRAATPLLVLTIAWFAFAALFATHPDIAIRRLVLAILTIGQAVAFLLLPEGREHLSRLMAVSALIVLGLCYAGVLLAPHYSIHQITDVSEPDLAGNWRGLFQHKNGTGALMVLLIFMGIFIARVSGAVLGSIIIGLAFVFLVFARAKSPLALLPLLLLVSWLIVRVRSPAAKVVLAIGTPLALNLLTIGSVCFPSVGAMLEGFMTDPTFTGRDEIWAFTMDHIVQRPIFGFGFQAFWGTAELLISGNIQESWGYRASDAHNGYLNIAVMTGLVGFVLAMLWIVIQPLVDLIRNPAGRSDPLTLLFVQIWLFGTSLSAFEAVFFSGGSPHWFMMVAAIVGLRYQAMMQTRG
jgi:O-antigen ligase